MLYTMYGLGTRLNHFFDPTFDCRLIKSFMCPAKQLTIPLSDKLLAGQSINESLASLWPTYLTLMQPTQRQYAPPMMHLKRKPDVKEDAKLVL